jgi:hypothetical protein
MIDSIRKWCHDSESIIYSRLKVGIGSALFIVQVSGADLHQFMSDKWYAVYQIGAAFLMMDGGIGEYVRRRRATYNSDGSLM